MKDTLEILYEDNHVIAVNKKASEIVQGDKTGDVTLPDRIKKYLKEKYQKPGNVFCGVIHRLDRPTSGVVLFARTSKGLERLNKQFREKETNKVYWAVTENEPSPKTGALINYLKKNESQNKSYVHSTEVPGSKKAVLNYKVIASSDNYYLLEIQLETGRHHQIRAQLSSIGCPIKGDVKYGAKRPNKDLSISLHARELSFIHPTTKEQISITAPVPEDPLWKYFTQELNCNQ
jgi:23S rRNA pseudouridine1911/1915/1917 synthase